MEDSDSNEVFRNAQKPELFKKVAEGIKEGGSEKHLIQQQSVNTTLL